MKKLLAALFLMLAFYQAHAQKIIAGADFVTNFDNREYGDNTFNSSITLFSAKLAPFAGINWDNNHNLIAGVNMRSDFGNSTKFMSDVKPIMYYKYNSKNVSASAGIFDKKEYIGNYSRAFFSDSTNFYSNLNSGFVGHYISTKRKNTYVELGLNWEGMYSVESREKFRLFTAGRFGFGDFYLGYAFSLFHFAGSKVSENVCDNLLINP